MSNIRAILAAVLAMLLGAGQAQSEPKVVATHGYWDVSCNEAAGKPAPGTCILKRQLGTDSDLQAFVLDRSANGNLNLRMAFETGLYLPQPVTISFDGEKRGTFPFERCLKQEAVCILETDAAPIETRLRSGGTISIAYAPDAQTSTVLDLGIDGFADALAELDRLNPPAADAPKAAVTPDFGAWKSVCENFNADLAKRQCRLVQSQRDGPTGSFWTVTLVPRTNGTFIMYVSATGTVVLKPGLGIALDGKPLGTVPFETCGLSGCSANAEIDPTLAARFRQGREVTLNYLIQPDRVVAVPVKLEGITEGATALAGAK